jgi:hypothetical protein
MKILSKIITNIIIIIYYYNYIQVGSHTIAESRKHTRINGYEVPPLVKPIIC